eukprot:CAMPEP_0196140358 /NCGR_PEP_ID=MMETSP0910-20130528/7294_1 /TAXON_ID=49265 /ORGANISM="Thalassiosira rotula, Strain GSO102" /LENGTH=124 /DNA_ID=CAMNT_0041401207 /DNA_START=121 /DNA_END=492 /DNA_ORIENTATION=-
MMMMIVANPTTTAESQILPGAMLEETDDHQLQQVTPDAPAERFVDIATRQKVLEDERQRTKRRHGFHETVDEGRALGSVGLIEAHVDVDSRGVRAGGDGEFDEGDAGLGDHLQVGEVLSVVSII